VAAEAATDAVATGVHLVAGHRYEFVGSGTWKDLNKSCGPDGYRSLDYPNWLAGCFLLLCAWSRRLPRARWFALVGAVDSARRKKFLIGSHRVLTADRDGELLCFANDSFFAYGNNEGSVNLTVTDLGT
jgi:hypothetical protein